jgi:hypothetical protein
MRFRAELRLNGKTATGIEVPPDVVEALGGGKRVPVAVTLKKHTYRTTVGPYAGHYLIPVSAQQRDAAGVKAGDVLDVTIVVDSAPRDVEVPADFAAAMKKAGVRSNFDALAYTHRKEHVRAIEDAMKPETRQRRIDKAIEKLAEA